jgi:hypothetical protein
VPVNEHHSVSNFRARVLPFAPRSWPLSTPSGLGLSHARGRKPVEDRPSARVLCLLSRYVAPLIISVVRALSLALSF